MIARSSHRHARDEHGTSRAAFSMVELIVALSITSVLLVGLTSAIMISTRSVQTHDGPAASVIDAGDALDRVSADVRLALDFSELGPTAASFTVPDRDEPPDDVPESIRYAWSGVAGDPLLRTYNDGNEVTVAENVHAFELSALTRTRVPATFSTPTVDPDSWGYFGESGASLKLLLVVPDETSPSAQDLARKSLVESWGYAVTMISASAGQTQFDLLEPDMDVAYVVEQSQSTVLGTKLRNAAIGIVVEEAELRADFGFSANRDWPTPRTTVEITDSTHEITSPFSPGLLTICSTDAEVVSLGGNKAGGLEALGVQSHQGSDMPSLVVIETGGDLYGGGTAAGRRVQLPWGRTGFDINVLTDDGRTLLRRAVEWTQGGGHAVLFVVVDPLTLSVQEQLRKTAMESWGHTVTPIAASSPGFMYDALFSLTEIVYVSEEVAAAEIGTKLTSAPIGVVNEEPELTDELGISSGRTAPFETKLKVTADAHPIVSSLGVGPIEILSTPQSVTAIAGTVAPGLEVLAEWNAGEHSLVALETGALLDGGGTAAGRRVQLPWGGSSFDFVALNGNGLKLMRDAIDWAAGNADDAASGRLGYDTAFSTPVSHVDGIQIATKATLPINGTVASISAYVDTGNGKKARFAIYSDADGEPDTLMVESNAVDGSNEAQWMTLAVDPTSLTAGDYWLALSFAHGNSSYHQDAGGETRYRNHHAESNGFLPSWGASDANYGIRISIYAEYTPD